MENTTNNFPQLDPLTPSTKKLDKKGVIILVVSLILSVIFFIIGFASLGGKKLEVGVSRTDSVDSYEYVTYKFKAEQSGCYILYVDNANLVSCEGEYSDYSWGTASYNKIPYSFDSGYIFVFSSDTTYTFEVYTQNSEITLLIEYHY